MRIKQARGYERRIFAKEDVCEALGIEKNKPLVADYLVSGDVVVFSKNKTSFQKIQHFINRIDEDIRNHLTAKKVYDSI